jgi:hypothetical protein
MRRENWVPRAARHSQSLTNQLLWVAHSSSWGKALRHLPRCEIAVCQYMPIWQINGSDYNINLLFWLVQDQRNEKYKQCDSKWHPLLHVCSLLHELFLRRSGRPHGWRFRSR